MSPVCKLPQGRHVASLPQHHSGHQASQHDLTIADVPICLFASPESNATWDTCSAVDRSWLLDRSGQYAATPQAAMYCFLAGLKQRA